MSSSLAWRCLLPHAAGPLARSSHAMAVVGTTAYLFGGENVPRVPVDPYVYTLNLMFAGSGGGATWERLELKPGSPEPQARIAPAMAALGETLWVFGGRMGIQMQEGPLDDLWAFDTAARTWTCVMESTAEAGGPSKRSFHQMVAHAGKLFVFGGCGPEGRLHDLHAFDPATKTWEALPANSLRGRGGAAVTAVEGKVIVVGGFAGEETRDMQAYDVAGKTWEDWAAHSATLIPRSVFGVAPLPGSGGQALVLFGGEVDPSSEGHMGAGGFAGDTLAFSLADKAKGWAAPPLAPNSETPSPRGWYAYSTIPGTGAFLIYGGLAPDNSRLGDMWILAPADPQGECSTV